MAFDQSTRGRLQKLVNSCRGLLSDEFSIQLQQTYGLDPNTGEVTPLARLTHLDDRQRHTAEVLRQTLAHYLGADADDTAHRITVLDRMVREQAFTVLNRLAALLMMEARGQLIESISKGYQSRGYQLYSRIAGTALGETGEAYQVYLFSVFDELAQELPALFNRYAANGLLFPRETALRALLDELNHFEIEPLWGEDETIGWIYQYFNSKEERKAMRDASQAPRNSRELAVRNQFFTPRYVVEFLVDNTLGRLWFNATGGQTELRDRCQYLLVKPDEQPTAATRLRDPRTLKLLDPACGSMHFGLYAFDLFLQIYQEAWYSEQVNGAGSLEGNTQQNGEAVSLPPRSHSYADEAAFLRDVPRLIIEHNIYGVDIDPRAAQIATLALWLRAQRSWHDAGVKAKDRPRIGQGHVVAAIAPPAERELRQSFAQQLDELDALLFDKTLVLLKNLPEMGVLLQVERELPHLIMQVYGGKGSGLFAAQEQETWQHAEQRLRIALEAFAHAARNTYQGRLFAQDALQGLRLIDLCREVFDVVVMNPPFGAPPPSYKKIDSSASIVNLYTAFVDRALDMGARYIGAITDRTFVVQSTFESFRMSLIDSSAPITALADLGWGVLDANVQVCAYTMTPDTSDICAFADVKEDIEKGELIKCNSEKWGYKSLSTFKNLPRTVLAYSIPNKILDLYEKWERLEHIADLPRGLGSNKAERTFRSWVEIPNVSENGVLRWASLANGGDFSPFWREDLGLTEWRSKKGFLWTSMSSSDGWRVYDQSAIDQYFIKGLSFPKQSSHFNVAILPSDYVPTREGKAILVHSDVDAIPLVGVLNSGLIGAIVRDTCGLHKQGRSISSIPVPPLDSDQKKRLGHLVGSLINYVKNSYTHDEVSRHFTLPYSLVNTENYLSEDDLTIILNEIDEIVLSKIDKDDEVLAWLEKCNRPVVFTPGNYDVLSWVFGVVFGRFDIKLALNEKTIKAQSDLFNKFPDRSPGILAIGEEKYFENQGIFVDDQGHKFDLPELMSQVIHRVHIQNEVELREWLRKEFFKFHLQRYTLCRRQSPIYWPLSTASGSYTLWIYYPSLSNQTLFVAVNDFLDGPTGKLTQVSRECAELRLKGSNRSRDEEKQYEALQTFEQELTDLRDTLLKIAPTYQPNHDDGVQITAAPLWPLFRHKPWQKVLKDTWAKLEKGDYDWAHLAMAYWPDRVREKCKTDKSLAIAHGLEDLYVEPEAAPKKTRGRKKAGGEE